MPFKSHSLNLWSPDGQTKLDIDVLQSKVNFTTTGGQSIDFSPVVKIGSIENVEQKFNDTDAAIAAGNVGSAAASSLVQTNLDAYTTSTNTEIATLNATVTSNRAISDANHLSDATSRVSLQTNLESKISTSELRAITAETTLTTNLSQEIVDRKASVSSEANIRQGQVDSLTFDLNVEKSRIDGILQGSTIDLNSLKELIDVFKSGSSDTLGLLSNIRGDLSQLTSRVDSLTLAGIQLVQSYALENVISELKFTNNEAFLSDHFELTFDMTDIYDSSSLTLIGWTAYKTLVIAGSNGILTASSSDIEVKSYIEAGLGVSYGDNFSGSASAATLIYRDPEHYLLEIGLVNGKPYFGGNPQNNCASCSWRLSYCSTQGDKTTIQSTVLSGTQSGNNLYISPQFGNSSVHFPVSGVSGVRQGFKASINSFVIQV